ncbi:hypothetical protein ACHAWX_007763 [Stephanocyclus meneghinianus]
MILRIALLFSLSSIGSDAFQVKLSSHQARPPRRSSTSHQSSKTSPGTSGRATTVPDFSSSTKPIDEAAIFADENEASSSASSWQENLELLMAPDTPMAERQILLSDLLNSGDQIQDSVRTALRERKIDSLLTPTGKRLQQGTRAVARQLTSDILPGIAAVVASSDKSSSLKTPKSPIEVLVEDLPTVVPKIGSRVFNALQNQAKKNFDNLQSDIMAGDPLRSISRIQEQTAELAQEAKNIFRETPEGLAGPPYRVVAEKDGYQIREYQGYIVASTSMTKVDEPYTMDDLASGGEAFNALAAYLFGANEEKEVMEMTTPVTTTSTGEMRFYLKERDNAGGGGVDSFPKPQAENDEVFNEKGLVKIQEIPPATLAVAKFTGFVTEGEVARQKDALLTSLAIDGIDIDVPHGTPVPHVIFQYNPPYTIPILRRNEIGIPVIMTEAGEDDLSLVKEWDLSDEN